MTAAHEIAATRFAAMATRRATTMGASNAPTFADVLHSLCGQRSVSSARGLGESRSEYFRGGASADALHEAVGGPQQSKGGDGSGSGGQAAYGQVEGTGQGEANAERVVPRQAGDQQDSEEAGHTVCHWEGRDDLTDLWDGQAETGHHRRGYVDEGGAQEDVERVDDAHSAEEYEGKGREAGGGGRGGVLSLKNGTFSQKQKQDNNIFALFTLLSVKM